MVEHAIKTIDYLGARMLVPEFLVPLWPQTLHLDDWPTYCGAGDGIGDWLVPDLIHGSRVCPACFVHDIDWSIADGSVEQFHKANKRFLANLKALVALQSTGVKRYWSYLRCHTYAMVVDSCIGRKSYNPTGNQDPYTNIEVKAKLRRLARASLRIPEIETIS